MLHEHYGVWNDDHGWFYFNSMVFVTESLAVAKAQCGVVNQIFSHKVPYHVYCFEDWENHEFLTETLVRRNIEDVDVP